MTMTMTMTTTQQLITIACVALATMLTRFLPFIIFPQSKETPKYIKYIGKVLPPAVFAMLVVYCFKDITPLSYPYALPEIISGALVIVLHLLKRNMLLSIGAGTVCYMLLIRAVFI